LLTKLFGKAPVLESEKVQRTIWHPPYAFKGSDYVESGTLDERMQCALFSYFKLKVWFSWSSLVQYRIPAAFTFSDISNVVDNTFFVYFTLLSPYSISIMSLHRHRLNNLQVEAFETLARLLTLVLRSACTTARSAGTTVARGSGTCSSSSASAWRAKETGPPTTGNYYFNNPVVTVPVSPIQVDRVFSSHLKALLIAIDLIMIYDLEV
jgi:hypothetical protein